MFRSYEKNGVTVLVLEGRLTASTVPAIEAMRVMLLDEKCVSRLVLDLKAVTYIGTQAFAVLFGMWNGTFSRGGNAYVVTESLMIRDSFRVMHYDKYFQFYNSTDQAVQSFSN